MAVDHQGRWPEMGEAEKAARADLVAAGYHPLTIVKLRFRWKTDADGRGMHEIVPEPK